MGLILPMRINKYLSESGVCSRREADRMVLAERIHIDGILAEVGSQVEEGQVVSLDGKVIEPVAEKKVYALNKPKGYISSLSDEQGTGISKFIPDDLRLFPVGRLDKASNGLMLLTNDGDLMNAVLKAANGHEKEYLVTVDRSVSREFLEGMASGVPIINGATGERTMTAPCSVIKVTDKSFKIILVQGLNRQIRRMCGYFEFKVIKLKRIRIMNIQLGTLGEGKIREITGEELEILKKTLG